MKEILNIILKKYANTIFNFKSYHQFEDTIQYFYTIEYTINAISKTFE